MLLLRWFPLERKNSKVQGLLNQLRESDNEFEIGHSNHSFRTEGRDNMTSGGKNLDNTNDATQGNYPYANVHTLEENIVSKVRSEVHSVMSAVDTKIQDAVMTAVENLVIPRVEMAIKSANASSGRSLDGNVLEPDQREPLQNVRGIQMNV